MGTCRSANGLVNRVRTFVPVYRYDPVYGFVIRRALPAIVWLLAVAGLAGPAYLFVSLWPNVPVTERDRFLVLVIALGGLMLSAPVMLLWLIRLIRRDALETEWTLDDEGLRRKRGTDTERRSWTGLDNGAGG